jgi:hypothetical protein
MDVDKEAESSRVQELPFQVSRRFWDSPAAFL